MVEVADIIRVRAELKEHIDNVRSELGFDIKDVISDINDVRSDVNRTIDGLKNDIDNLKDDIVALKRYIADKSDSGDTEAKSDSGDTKTTEDTKTIEDTKNMLHSILSRLDTPEITDPTLIPAYLRNRVVVQRRGIVVYHIEPNWTKSAIEFLIIELEARFDDMDEDVYNLGEYYRVIPVPNNFYKVTGPDVFGRLSKLNCL
jgi:hypothetical protein